MATSDQLLAAMSDVIDLAHPVKAGMPGFPNNPPYVFALTRPHGRRVQSNGASAAVEVVTTSTHAGTHVDALGHFSLHGRLHGGVDAAHHQSYERGLVRCGVEEMSIGPHRAVLLDVARCLGQEPLPRAHEISAHELQRASELDGVEIRAGDVVLIRTGWGALWGGSQYSERCQPGCGLEAATWLSDRRPSMLGGDTLAFEPIPAPGWPVHVHLLVERGIHILESLNLEVLSARRIGVFVFWAPPLRLVGATGSMLRPIAIVTSDSLSRGAGLGEVP